MTPAGVMAIGLAMMEIGAMNTTPINATSGRAEVQVKPLPAVPAKPPPVVPAKEWQSPKIRGHLADYRAAGNATVVCMHTRKGTGRDVCNRYFLTVLGPGWVKDSWVCRAAGSNLVEMLESVAKDGSILEIWPGDI